MTWHQMRKTTNRPTAGRRIIHTQLNLFLLGDQRIRRIPRHGFSYMRTAAVRVYILIRTSIFVRRRRRRKKSASCTRREQRHLNSAFGIESKVIPLFLSFCFSLPIQGEGTRSGKLIPEAHGREVKDSRQELMHTINSSLSLFFSLFFMTFLSRSLALSRLVPSYVALVVTQTLLESSSRPALCVYIRVCCVYFNDTEIMVIIYRP